MKTLLILDKKDYTADMPVFEKFSTRAVIIRNGKIATQHGNAGDYKKELLGLAREMKISDNIVITGFLDEKDYIKDPLLSFKAPRMLKKSSQFFMYTDNYEQPTILTEIWRPTWS